MTEIKLCGLSRICDIEAANELKPAYVGFVFAPKSKRTVTLEKAKELKQILSSDIQVVGVFVNEKIELITHLLKENIIDIVQLHGDEDYDYIGRLKELVNRPIIKAFCISSAQDIESAKDSTADYVLLDAGAGTGTAFDWELIQNIKRPYFLAGGLAPDNVKNAIQILKPYGVDVSSGIETNGVKDQYRMAEFVAAVREADKL